MASVLPLPAVNLMILMVIMGALYFPIAESALGADCSADATVCAAAANEECTAGACTCMSGYTASADNSTCDGAGMTTAAGGGAGGGGPEPEPEGGGAGGGSPTNVALDGACSADDECAGDDVKCTSLECKCASGFKPKDDKSMCIKDDGGGDDDDDGVGSLTASLTTLLLCLLAPALQWVR